MINECNGDVTSIEEMAGSDRVLTRTIQSEPRLETRKPTKRAKWRSSMSAYTSVAQNVLDTADIVRDGDLTSSNNTDCLRPRCVRRTVLSPS